MPSIKIVQLNGTVEFQPDDPPGDPGQPLGVDRGESVTWNNETDRSHWPWPIDAQGNLLSAADAKAFGFHLSRNIPKGGVSSPEYNSNPQFSPPLLPPPTITYVCRHHRKERGSIVVREL
jgi:hypothetical protein